MTNDNWKTSKLAIGRFYSDANTGLKDDNGNPITIGEVWGINTELLAGNLIIGNNMVLENANDEGVMQFKIDATGAWLYNASYVMQHDDGGLMILILDTELWPEASFCLIQTEPLLPQNFLMSMGIFNLIPMVCLRMQTSS